MTKPEYKKKIWIKPVVNSLSIKKDTFTGSGSGAEKAGKGGPPRPPGR